MTTPFFSFVRPLAVVAFGGNALLRPEDPGDSPTQLVRARDAVRTALEMADVFSQLRAQAAGGLH